MTNFSQKIRLNRTESENDDEQTFRSEELADSLRFSTHHSLRPGKVDLYEFAIGVPVTEQNGAKARSTFTGRSDLIAELAPAIFKRYRNKPETSIKQLITTLRWWWKFFDSFELTSPTGTRFTSALQWESVHYAYYRFGHMKGVRFCQDSTASLFFTLLSDVRRPHDLPFWWKAIGTPDKQRNPICDADIRKLYHHFTGRVRAAMLRIETSIEDTAPTSDEIRCFIVLFILYSGWNPQVVLDIDIGTRNLEGTPACIRPSYKSPTTHSVVVSIKLRAGGKLQQTESMNKHTLSPANLLLFLDRHTKQLRSELELSLQSLINKREKLKAERDVCADLDLEIARLRQKLCSPWLYRSRAYNYHEVGCISGTDDLIFRVNTRDLQPIAWATELINADIEKRRNRLIASEEIPPPHLDPVATGHVLTDLRDAFIIWRYENSGYSWIEGLLASGSSGFSALKSYLNKKRLKAHAERQLTQVTNAVWHTIRHTAMVAPNSFTTVVAARVSGVPEGQIKNWLSQRTYAGTGCRDILNPPKKIAPRNQTGSRCSAQRCLICPTHAILITDERGANDLAKVRAEIDHIRGQLSLAAWVQSDWPIELGNIEAAWKEFDQAYIDGQLAWWKAEIESGRHAPVRA